ncbi:hypothetical protein [uncultured Polaribacter sp.]|nr:hypothetical protein [uncultured Polaribacter sp.]
MENEFLQNTSLISYSKKSYQNTKYEAISDIELTHTTTSKEWLNIYRIN